jgi:hypothetical protein
VHREDESLTEGHGGELRAGRSSERQPGASIGRAAEERLGWKQASATGELQEIWARWGKTDRRGAACAWNRGRSGPSRGSFNGVGQTRQGDLARAGARERRRHGQGLEQRKTRLAGVGARQGRKTRLGASRHGERTESRAPTARGGSFG